MDSKERVIAAMSGGVDSSVAAAVLLEQGYDVMGATLVFKPTGEDTEVIWSCGRDAVESARSVARTLGIQHYTIECSNEFEESVLRPSWREYRAGRTPSPCILCNSTMKFGLLLERGKQLGATRVATGHYARVIDQSGVPTLSRGLDPAKDQSYFLFSLSAAQLGSTLFPLGETAKDRVRETAKSLNLSSAERPDSQDACFGLSDGGFSSALARRFGEEPSPGRVIDRQGEILGHHVGVHHYTVGQRKGLNIALGKKAYVSNINAKDSTVTLSDNPEDLMSRGLSASGMLWSSAGQMSSEMRCEAQIRYRHKAAPATVKLISDNEAHVFFDDPQRAVAPGQAVVLYDGVRVIGGGWIDSSFSVTSN